jgi:tRNA/rRNA methyltransferase
MSQKPVIILVEPQMGENIGACARAMLNCGLEELRIVNPRDGWPNEKADAMSAGALSKMPPVKVYGTTVEAVADCHYIYATTARPRDMLKPVLDAKQAAADVHARISQGQTCAYLFGPERSGLNNEDVALSHAILTIPVNPAFSSFNIAAGVLLCAYEWYQKSIAKSPPLAPPHAGGNDLPPFTGGLEGGDNNRLPASHASLNNLYNRLEEELAAGGFFRTQEIRPTVMRNLKNMLSRAEMTEQEVNTFHGIITALIRKN